MKVLWDIEKESGRRVKSAAKQNGLTQKQLASQANMSESKLQKIYQGDRARPLQEYDAEILAGILGVRKEYLMCIDNDRTEEEHTRRLRSEYLHGKALYASFVEQFLKNACELTSFDYEGHYMDSSASDPWAAADDFRFQDGSGKRVFIDHASIDSWMNECIRYAAFSLSTIVQEELKAAAPSTEE